MRLFPLLCFLFSCIIWKIDINTDDRQLKNTLAHSLYNQGIYRGSTCTKDQLADVQRQLMLENKNLGYITLNFYKGILTCEVYRRQERKDEKESYSFSDIVCLMDGVVTDVRVYRGFSQVQSGQSVSRGDVLVKCEELDIRGRLSQSQTAAYIAGDCEKEYTVFVPYNKTVPVYTGKTAQDEIVSFLGIEHQTKKADLSGFSMYTQQQVISSGNIAGFCFPYTVKTITYSRLEQQQISGDFPSVRKAAVKQLQHLISNDTKLEEEYSRRYDYRMEEEGVTAVCRVKGRYIII